MAIAPLQPGQAPVTPQPAKPRQMITELGSETFEFPRERGTPAPPPDAPQTVAPKPPAPAPIQNEKTYAETDPEFFSIDLPSGFQFYDFKHISARTLMAAHQAKFSRAQKEEKLRYTVEGISGTLEPSRSAFDLSVADFYFLMYWQRVNSYSKNPMLVTSYCDNTQHNEKVYIGYEAEEPAPDSTEEAPKTVKVHKKMEEDTLKTEVLLNNTTLETKYLDPVDFDAWPIKTKYDLHIETMRDVVEVTEFLGDTEDITEEDLYLIKYAVFVRRREDRQTLKDRMAVVATIPPDDMVEFDQYIEAVTAYGVSEFAVVKCKGCGASSKVKITLDALTFLPSGRRA